LRALSRAALFAALSAGLGFVAASAPPPPVCARRALRDAPHVTTAREARDARAGDAASFAGARAANMAREFGSAAHSDDRVERGRRG